MTRRGILLGLLALWLVTYLASLVYPPTLAAEGDGFTRGINRVMTFLGLQFGAGLIAVAVLAVRPSQGRLRWIALIPAALAALLLLAIAGLILWSRVAHG
ncbi:phenylalanyl-tRNA synthetase beta subunit [Pseudooceanicola batsensis HTCC2597]|uniref:Phenylalanyl-tRNA synthetase beta subunit n=1 Tax=Pseudooceanicola batsensis (strain ATCC BAA-863 / DSM 15984 / KCTC 12145 / HTCC2597) TaxID=252305 RepID=A3TVP6_PSEBH|nr:hypothetical protein [Pseudooceanicola batsensis]EAQ03692.1 phenylalanyl-tRNA synthetase beta subunit [Pseudooceanicola batsensis HTCC2597]